MSVPFLDLYESLDVIGNGSFGIIRKVRRKNDGQIYARKELNFDRMSERDRKQIVAEVNILKDLHHGHIVRYHDRHVDRDAGILYIMMEYCGGGDLSTIIKQATKQNRPIPEDTVWNYFMQILLALNHCHHPNGHSRTSSGTSSSHFETDNRERRSQILHRDIKPDNVFLDELNHVKLGDFGLSKALVQASFASTYVGTPYYMSPELMQEKAYDSKSDIWSLGCLIYELCALKPPFHEAKTHAELAIFIRNGRIPPLPKGYSQSLQSIIKAMLNLNPAMRPSAQQLLQHERLELVFKVSETEKILNTVKTHKATVTAKEKEVAAKEATLREREQHMDTLLAQKDQEIQSLQQLANNLQAHAQNSGFTAESVEASIQEAVYRRESELRQLVAQREDEVKEAIAKREVELMEAMRHREVEVLHAWEARELELRAEFDQQIKHTEEQAQWVTAKHDELQAEEIRLDNARLELDRNIRKWEADSKGRKEKAPLEEVKNLLEPLGRVPSPHRPHGSAVFATPLPGRGRKIGETPQSAMKGVIFTATGEPLTTPAPLEIATIFNKSPKVGLNFGKIFEKDQREVGHHLAAEIQHTEHANDSSDDDRGPSPPPSPSSKRERARVAQTDSTTLHDSKPRAQTRIRRPSIRRDSHPKPLVKSSSTSDPTNIVTPSNKQSSTASRVTNTRGSAVVGHSIKKSAEYDLADEESLPSPFLRRAERPVALAAVAASEAGAGPSVPPKAKRTSHGGSLRVAAVVNSAGRRPSISSDTAPINARKQGKTTAPR